MVEHNTDKYHSWNLVKLDGDWYITDIFSDAGTGNYAHFNLTDSMFGQEQQWDHDYFPTADSFKYNMAYRNKKTVDTVYDLAKALREAMNEKLGCVMVGFKQDIKDEDAQIATAIASSIDNILMSQTYENMPYSVGSYNWVKDPDNGKYLFNVAIGQYNTTNGSEGLTEKQQEKVDKLVQKAFDGLKPVDSNGMGMTGEKEKIGEGNETVTEKDSSGSGE